MGKQQHPAQDHDSEADRACAARRALARWRVAFARDAVLARLVSLSGLLAKEVEALEERGRTPADRAPAPPPVVVAPAAPPPAPSVVEREREPSLLSGRIEEGMLADVFQMVSANGKTGLFRVVGKNAQVDVWFVNGEVVHAASGNLSGEDAFYAALAQTTGTFSLQETADVTAERTISSKTQFLILEGLRRIDEEAQTGEGGG